MAANLHPVEGVTRCPCGAKYWDADICASCGERFQPEPPTPTHFIERMRDFGWEILDEAYTAAQAADMRERYAVLSAPYVIRARKIASC